MSLEIETPTSDASTVNQQTQSPSPGVEGEFVEPTDEDIQIKPWKYVGYRGYSKFLASDDDLLIFRRFSVLNTRTLLLLQDQICELEQELLEVDRIYGSKNSEDYNNGTFRDDLEDRTELLGKITSTISQYNALLLQQSALRNHPNAPQRDIKNINRWHYNHGWKAIDKEETQYLQRTDDLVSITQKEKTPLRQFIDKSRRLRTLRIWQQPGNNNTNEGPQHDRDQDVSYYSDKRIDTFTSLTIVFIGIAMLLTPIWILQSLQAPTTKLVVITIFILAFLITLSYAMVTKPFEALGATAAYAAVLMVFLQVGKDG
ncbi:Glycoside hydrolase- family 43 [Apiospora arundinis]